MNTRRKIATTGLGAAVLAGTGLGLLISTDATATADAVTVTPATECFAGLPVAVYTVATVPGAKQLHTSEAEIIATGAPSPISITPRSLSLSFGGSVPNSSQVVNVVYPDSAQGQAVGILVEATWAVNGVIEHTHTSTYSATVTLATGCVPAPQLSPPVTTVPPSPEAVISAQNALPNITPGAVTQGNG